MKKTKTYAMQAVELRFGKPLEAVIREQIEAGRTQEEIANAMGVSYWTFRNWLRRLEARMVMSVRFPGEERAISR